MLSHLEFTKAFQTGIDTKIAPEGTIGEGARFDVYRNNSLHSRIEALRVEMSPVQDELAKSLEALKRLSLDDLEKLIS